MLAMFEDLASERTKQRSELSHNSKRLLDVGRVSSVFLQDEETKTSHNVSFTLIYHMLTLSSYIMLCIFALIGYLQSSNMQRLTT